MGDAMNLQAMREAAKQLVATTRAHRCDPDCARCRHTIAMARAIARGDR